MKRNKTTFLLWAVLFVSAIFTTGSSAAEQILAVGVDRKFTYDEVENTYTGLAPGNDEVIFYSLASPEKPKLIGRLSIDNSIIGPPTNIAISPDQKIALVASAIRTVVHDNGNKSLLSPSLREEIRPWQ